MFSLPNLEKEEVFDFDSFEMSNNLILFDFDNIAPSSCFMPVRQSPRHSTPSPIQNKSPRHNAFSPITCHLAQLNWVPFSDISPRDFELLLCSGSKRKLLEDPLPNHKRSKEVTPYDTLQTQKSSNTKSKSKKTTMATKKNSKI